MSIIYDGFEREIYQAILFDKDGNYHPEFDGFWKARQDDSRISADIAAALKAVPWGSPAEAYSDLHTVASLSKPASDWRWQKEIVVSAAQMQALHKQEEDRMCRVWAYRGTHDAYGRVKHAEDAHRRGWMFVGRDSD